MSDNRWPKTPGLAAAVARVTRGHDTAERRRALEALAGEITRLERAIAQHEGTVTNLRRQCDRHADGYRNQALVLRILRLESADPLEQPGRDQDPSPAVDDPTE